MIEYKYAGLPLTSSIAAELLREALETGALHSCFTRNQAELCVRELHLHKGGVPSGRERAVLVTRPLADWEKVGWVESPAVGAYRWRGADSNLPPATEPELRHEYPELTDDEVQSYVYMFYYETDCRLAALESRDFWPCKVGRTSRAPGSRVAEQFNSHYHTRPKISVVWPTDNAVALEKAVHALLELRGRRMPGSVGTEWFYTNPDELTNLLAQIDS